MTPDEFREARRKLGLSQQQLAELMCVQSGRTIRRWENGERDIPGPAQVLLALWAAHPDLLDAA